MRISLRLVFVCATVSVLAACANAHSTTDEADAGGVVDAGVDMRIAISFDAGFDAAAPVVRDAAVDLATPPPIDAGHDAHVRTHCERMDVHDNGCMLREGVRPTMYYWTGDHCAALIYYNDCAGSQCDEMYAVHAECEEAFADCLPSLCENSGGTWFVHYRACEHFRCGGLDASTDCENPGPVCDCGAGREFDPAVGCVDSSEPCADELLCVNTRGVWREGICGPTHCGELSGDDCTDPGCDCGRMGRWEAGVGCIADAIACPRRSDEPESSEYMCMHTGGEWDPEACDRWWCGPYHDPYGGCWDGACTCAYDEVFENDPATGSFGCVRKGFCLASRRHSPCETHTSCSGGSGTICCPDASGVSTCVSPVCGGTGPIEGCP